MAQTPQTTAVPYCSPAQLLQGRDRRPVSQLLDDADGPPPTRAAMLDPASDPGRLLLDTLLAASWDVEAACLAGGRYTPADLQALTGAGQAGLARLTAALAYWKLQQRRQPATSDPKGCPGVLEAMRTLDRLRSGERVLPFAEAMEAGISHAVGPGVVNGVLAGGPVYGLTRGPDPWRFGPPRGGSQGLGRLFGDC